MNDWRRDIRNTRIVCGILAVICAVISIGSFYEAGAFG